MTSDELRSFRKKKGWDQAKAAAEIGVSVHTVRAWEQGKNPIPPSVEKLLLHETELKIPLDLVIAIHQQAKDVRQPFEEVLYAALRKGIESLRDDARGSK